MPPDDFWPWAILSLVAGLAGFYFTFRNLMRARIIEDTPTAKIRSAHQGYVELVGHTESMDGRPIIAPLTGSECCWYHYKIERKSGKDEWKTLEQETSAVPFLLRDETDVCIIYPEGADVTPTDQSTWFGHTRQPTDRNPPRHRLDAGSGWTKFSVVRGDHRYTERRIYPGDQLYTIGAFKTLDDIDHQRSRQAMARDLLRQWKQDHDELLERFDHNNDGRIDVEEWEQARAQAVVQATREHAEQLMSQVLHTLSKTTSRRHPFLLSSLPQFSLVRRYRIWSVVSAVAFFVAGALATAMLTARFVG